MKLYFLYGTNLPEGVDRLFLIKIFQQFGEIRKIYIHPDVSWFKIYFMNKECADEAASLNESPPHFMQLTVSSEDAKDRPKKQSQNLSLQSNSNGSMSYNDSDYYASTGPEYYNIHGVSVSTLISDDGTIFVPLDEVREIGFELFEDNKIPKNISFNKQAFNEFKIYLNIQARKYIDKMQWSKPSDKAIEEVKNEVINKYASNGPLRSNTAYRQYDNTSSVNSNKPPLMTTRINTDQVHQTGGFDRQRNTRNSTPRNTKNKESPPLQPLRHPVQVNDNVPRNTQTIDKEQKYCQSEVESVVNTNGISSKSNKENLGPKTEEIPVKQKHFLKFSEPKIKQIELALNKSVMVTVSFVNSEKKCWAYKKEDEDRMQNILCNVNLEAKSKPSVEPSVGKIYAATYEGIWYRALVHEDTPNVKVQYLDFGNFNEEKLEEVRELSSEVLSEPMLTVHLNFTTPPQTPLEPCKELTIIPTKKNNDGSYDVQEVSEKPRTPESSKLNVIPAGKIINSESIINTNIKQERFTAKTETVSEVKSKVVQTQNRTGTKPKSPQSFNNQSNVLSPPGTSQTLKERIQHMSSAQKEVKIPDRKSVLDIMNNNDSGIIQFLEKVKDDTCLGFVYAFNFADAIGSLEKITETENIVGKVGDLVSMFYNEAELWVRATILNIENDMYTVALVDYGKIISTGKVCKLERKFVDVPEFVCILSGKAECIKLLEENAAAEFTSTENKKMKLSIQDVFYNITCSRWNPFESFKTKKISSQKIYMTIPSAKELRDKERVLPVILNEEKLLVRNKESNAVLTKVKEEISKHTVSPLEQEPVVGQLVLCPHDTQTILCRAIIKSLNRNYADVEFIDYGFTDTIPIKKIMAITESLAKEDSSLIPIILKGFENGAFSDDVIKFVDDSSTQNKKYVVKKYSDNIFDLIIDSLPAGEVTLSSKLGKSSVVKNNRLMYQNTTACEMEIGKTEDVTCIAIEEESGLIKLIPNNNVHQKMCDLTEEISKCMTANTKAYSPIVDELCLAKYDGEWYRASVIKVNEALEMYEVYYLDFGNVATVSSNDIRKISERCSQLPVLALTGCFAEIADVSRVTQSVLNVIKNEITVGESYKVEVLNKLEKIKYLIRIPSLSIKLLEIIDF